MRTRYSARVILTLALLGAAGVSASSCGTDRHLDDEGARHASFERLRTAVLQGAAEDFAAGTGIGGPKFEACVLRRLSQALDPPTMERLVRVHGRPEGQQLTAQALNGIAAPLAVGCGHRAFVPELVEASRRLRAGGPNGSVTVRVTYGPYLGVRCRRPNRISCDRVGIDVVLSVPAERVTAVVGARRLRLRTPGAHSGVRQRDWIGTFEKAGLSQPGSPFYIDRSRHGRLAWAGSPAVRVPVGLKVAFAGGRSGGAFFPAVLLSPGWG